MSDYVERMKVEHLELSEKVRKLSDYIDGPYFQAIGKEAQDLLVEQRYFMCGYLEVLAKRLARICEV